jgi:hypothetical protein
MVAPVPKVAECFSPARTLRYLVSAFMSNDDLRIGLTRYVIGIRENSKNLDRRAYLESPMGDL